MLQTTALPLINPFYLQNLIGENYSSLCTELKDKNLLLVKSHKLYYSWSWPLTFLCFVCLSNILWPHSSFLSVLCRRADRNQICRNIQKKVSSVFIYSPRPSLRFFSRNFSNRNSSSKTLFILHITYITYYFIYLCIRHKNYKANSYKICLQLTTTNKCNY